MPAVFPGLLFILQKILNTRIIYWLLDSSPIEPLCVGDDRLGESRARRGLRALSRDQVALV